MGRDVLLFWDGIYRISKGQIPHLDFVTQLGYLNFAGPFFISGMDTAPDAILKYIITCSIIVVTGALLLLSNIKDSNLYKSLFILFVCSVILSLLSLGDLNYATFHGFYRRICASILIVIILYCFIPKEKLCNALLSSGILAILGYILFFTKVTYFVAALSVLLSSVIFQKTRYKELGLRLFSSFS